MSQYQHLAIHTITEVEYADGHRESSLVEIEGPVTPSGDWGRAKLYWDLPTSQRIFQRLDQLLGLNPWDNKRAYDARRRRLGAQIAQHGMDITVYA